MLPFANNLMIRQIVTKTVQAALVAVVFTAALHPPCFAVGNSFRVEVDKNAKVLSIFEISVFFDEPFDGNPFDEAVVSATMTYPDKTKVKIQGFCDDQEGKLFRLRFTPTSVGVHHYQIHIHHNSRRVQTAGRFSAGRSDLNGFAKTDPANPKVLRLHNGERPLFISKTAWLLLGSKTWKSFIDQAHANGFNVLRFGLEVNYYSGSAGIDVWPWEGTRNNPDYTRFDVEAWQHYDTIFRYAMSKEMYMEPVIFTQVRRNSDSFWYRFFPDRNMQRYWRYLMARLNAYPNIVFFQLFNEFEHNKAYQRKMAGYLQKFNPAGHLITTSGGTTKDAIWPQEPWNDLAINHSCTSSDPEKHGLWSYYYKVAQNISKYGKPAWIDESGRVRHKNTDPIYRRKEYWIWSMVGVYWNYHSAGGCEDIEKHPLGPGEPYIKPIWEFWSKRTDWATKDLSGQILVSKYNVDYALARSDSQNQSTVIYLFNEITGSISADAKIQVSLPQGEYKAIFISPKDGTEEHHRSRHIVISESLTSIEIPQFVDDILLFIDKI